MQYTCIQTVLQNIDLDKTYSHFAAMIQNLMGSALWETLSETFYW